MSLARIESATSERAVIDLAAVIERQKLGRLLVALVMMSWIIAFFDGFDMQAIAFAAPYLSSKYHLDRLLTLAFVLADGYGSLLVLRSVCTAWRAFFIRAPTAATARVGRRPSPKSDQSPDLLPPA